MSKSAQESYIRIQKKIFEVKKKSFLSKYDDVNDYVSNFGIYVGKGDQALLTLKSKPIIEETFSKYPVSDNSDVSENSNGENFGWKWIGDDWRHDGADSYMYANSVSFKKFPVEDSKWSKSSGFFTSVERRVIYRYAIKKGVNQDEIQWLRKHKYDIVSISDNSFKNNISNIKNSLNQEFKNVEDNSLKPNILLLGGSGAGKSSLVNAVFGKSLAEIGNGLPVTQTYTKFEDPDINVVIYDSKGIEHGSIEDGFIEDTKKFFYNLRKSNPITGHIHVVWYVIDLTQARFQPFEAEFCKENLKDIPIIFVFNKADAVQKKTRDIMIETVKSFNLPNCYGLFPTVAQCKNFDRKDCPECGSLRIRKRVKDGSCTILCKDCNQKTEMHQTEGIVELSNTTISVLPNFVKSVFVNAQKSKAIFQEENAKSIARKYCETNKILKDHTLLTNVSNMIDELTELYDAKILSDYLKKYIINQLKLYYLNAGTLKRLKIRFTNNSGQAIFLACALEVCRNCILFKEKLAKLSLENDINESLIAHEILSSLTFKVDKYLINHITSQLSKSQLENYLDLISIDGTLSYHPDSIKKHTQEKKKVDIVLHPYQKYPSKNAPIQETSSQDNQNIQNTENSHNENTNKSQTENTA